MAKLDKVRVQLLDQKTGEVLQEVDVLTSASAVFFEDGQTFQQKLDSGVLKGQKGDTGAKGEKGDIGATGAQGPKGDRGDKGERGATGAQGPKGDKGDKGDRGEKGDSGEIVRVGANYGSAKQVKIFLKTV